VNILDRIRRFWLPGPGPDHLLTDEERKGVPATAVDEVASLAEGFIGESFDPDAATERP
jgi:hypothetical protein